MPDQPQSPAVGTSAESSWIEVLVAGKTDEAIDICSLELVDPEGRALPAFSAGSHILVRVRDGLTRSYSLCNAPSESHRYLVAVLRDPGSRGGSAAVHDDIQPGQVIRISAPRNHFALAAAAPRSLLLAGGIGVTPILCMAEHLAVAGAPFEMHYCSRSRERAAFLNRIEASAYREQVQLHFDDGAAEQRLDIAKVLAASAPGTHLYVCGPQGFIDAVIDKASASGWPQERIHSERFAGEVAPQLDDGSFEVELAKSGQVVMVPKDQTVVQALSGAGIVLETSCEQGICGVCLTRVLDGIPDHRDMCLSDEEKARNNQFTPCCSRAFSRRLLLDL
jgi:vanillate O-demethylase ferredoxin subunit